MTLSATDIGDQIGKFRETSCVYGDVHFQFRRMSAWVGFHVLERLRPGLGGAVAQVPVSLGIEKAIGLAIVRLPAETVQAACAELFKFVDFRTRHRQKFVPLSGAEDEAFAELEAIHVYYVLGRAFAVNFTGSWDAIASLMEEESPTIPQPDTETSPPSSPLQ